MTDALTIRHRLAASPESVFEALTTTKALETWLAERADADVQNGRFEFWGRFSPDGERGRQQLLDAERPRSLRFAWTLGRQQTDVQIELAPTDSGTSLTLKHAGLAPREGAEAWVGDWWLLVLDNLASFVEQTSIGPRVDFTGFTPHVARVETDIDAAPEAVFSTLIEPAQLERWIATRAVVEPTVGGRYDFGWDHGPVKILELEPSKKLAYSWHFPDYPETVVTWELEGSGGRTHLTLVHSGFGADRSNEGHEIGWAAYVASLKRMIEVGDSWRRIAELQPAAA
jgi:uncharacterized protein YndB with AHSA1/START domain